MRSTGRRCRQSGGFTLIELILGLVIFATMMSVIYAVLFQMLRLKSEIDDRRDAQMVAESVLSRITRELGLAIGTKGLIPPEEEIGQQRGLIVYFRGKADRIGGNRRADAITFMAAEGGQYVPDGGTHNGTVQISYRMAKDPEADEGYVLVREELPAISPPKRAYEKRMVFPVTKAIENFSVRYFDKESGRWEEEWGETRHVNNIPSIIEVTLALRSPRGLVDTYTTAVAPRTTRTGSGF